MREERILIRSKTGQIVESIDLNEMDKITVKNEYMLPDQSLKDMYNELIRNHQKNYFIFHKRKKGKKL